MKRELLREMMVMVGPSGAPGGPQNAPYDYALALAQNGEWCKSDLERILVRGSQFAQLARRTLGQTGQVPGGQGDLDPLAPLLQDYLKRWAKVQGELQELVSGVGEIQNTANKAAEQMRQQPKGPRPWR